jgi:hypothetical protein
VRYSIEKRGCYTVNPYPHRSKNKIDIVLHEGGMQSKDAQPQVSLLLGGKTLSVQWKMPEKLFSDLQAGVLRHHTRDEEGGSRRHRRILQGTSSDH